MILAAGPEHAAGIASVYAPYVTDTAISFETDPPDAAEMARRMSEGLPWFVTGDVDGFAYATRHRARAGYRWAVECSVYLRPEAQGRGAARALYARLFDELRSLGYVHVLAGIALPNDRSVRLHQAMGFGPVGVYRQVGFKLGRWHDVAWWQLQLVTPPEQPDGPRGVP